MDLQDEIAIIKTKLEDKKTEKKEVRQNAFWDIYKGSRN
jgi:hypothetical protein